MIKDGFTFQSLSFPQKVWKIITSTDNYGKMYSWRWFIGDRAINKAPDENPVNPPFNAVVPGPRLQAVLPESFLKPTPDFPKNTPDFPPDPKIN